jgi:hypothetical protein
MGQELTSLRPEYVVCFALKADVKSGSGDVSFVPGAEITKLNYHCLISDRRNERGSRDVAMPGAGSPARRLNEV